MHHHVTSLNSRVVFWRPKQDNHVGGNQSDIFPFASILNTEAGIGTSSLSSLSQEVSQCGVSATALPYNTGENADSYLKEKLENKPVIESSFVSESITNTVLKSYETDAEMMNGNSKIEDSYIGSENNPGDSDVLSDKLRISKNSDNSYEEPEILRGLSSPSYEPETMLSTCSPNEELENLRGCNKPSDESHQGSGKSSKQSNFTKDVESMKRKRNTHENMCTDTYVKTCGQLYETEDDHSMSSDRQRSHIGVIIDMINDVKEKVLSLEQQKYHVQGQKSHEVAHHSLCELRESCVIKHIQDHPLKHQDMSNKNSTPVGMSKKRSYKNQVKGIVSYEKSHSQEIQQHPHTNEKKVDSEKGQVILKLDRDKHFLEPCQAEERPAFCAKDVLQSPSSVQQCWKYKDITAPLDFTKILNKLLLQLQKWKESTQIPSFKIQALIYQLYIRLQELEENCIAEGCHAPPPPKEQHLLHWPQNTKCYVHKGTQVHLQENLVNQKDIIQKDSVHELKSHPSGHQDIDFNDGKRKESKEVTKPVKKTVDGELCNFAPDLNIGTLLSDEQQRSVSIYCCKEVIETDCVSTLLKEIGKGTDLFCGLGNANKKLDFVKNEVKGQILGSLDHLPENQSEITIFKEFRPSETSVNCIFPRSTSIGHTERSPAAKKQNERNVCYEAK